MARRSARKIVLVPEDPAAGRRRAVGEAAPCARTTNVASPARPVMSRSRASGTQTWPESIVWTEVFMTSTTADVAGVEGAAGVAPLQGDRVALGEAGRSWPCGSPMRTGISSAGRAAPRTDVGMSTTVWAGSMPLTRTVNSAAAGVDRALDDEDRRGPAGRGQGRRGRRARGRGRRRGSAGRRGRRPAASSGRRRSRRSIMASSACLFIPSIEALDEDDEDEGERQDEDVEPGPEAVRRGGS